MQNPHQETWSFDSFDRIGGYPVEVTGNPALTRDGGHSAIAFDGIGDRLLVRGNPLHGVQAFTVEVVFKPGAGVNAKNDPRFLHLMDPADPDAKRLMVEIRVNDKGRWTLDAMLKTDAGERAVLDLSIEHPADEWVHAAVTYDGGMLRTFVGGKPELAGPVTHRESILGPGTVASVGARMNKVHWLFGSIRTLRFTHAALSPSAFLRI